MDFLPILIFFIAAALLISGFRIKLNRWIRIVWLLAGFILLVVSLYQLFVTAGV
ncbi:hypothetical protein [Lactobacillus selangorensis]|uniref:hypothetical protein n=1 Tax=Lactobacillus selangorensis TaxID=81857 RepID=UPI0012E39E55|nr:hypothetical protein [Lactobacillus selangorensis]